MSTKLSQNRLPIFTIFWLTEFFDFFVPSGSASSEMTTMAVPKVNAPKSVFREKTGGGDAKIALHAKRTSPHTSNFSRREINIRCPALDFLAKLNPRHGAPMFWRKFENDMGFSTQNMFFLVPQKQNAEITILEIVIPKSGFTELQYPTRIEPKNYRHCRHN